MPPSARTSTPWPVIAFIALQLALNGQRSMAAFLIVGFSSYFRPGTNMRLRRKDLIPPVAGVSTVWTMLANARDAGQPSKTGTFDDSVLWDDPLFAWMGKVFEVLKVGNPDLPLWPFNYIELSRAIAKVVAKWELNFVPYQLRHAGPAWDRLHEKRTLMDVQKRGGWRAFKSVARYEKGARVTAEFLELPASLRAQCLEAVDKLETVILGC